MKILVSALDWGLGHATRIEPIINYLEDNGHSVVIAGSGNSLQLLKRDFPNLECAELQSFSPWFFKHLPQWLAIAIQVPNFLLSIKKEYKLTQSLLNKYDIDIIISDNRYGVRSEKCKSYIITHQTSPKISSWCPHWFEKILSKRLCKYINKFDECLIPDKEPAPNGLSGILSDTQYVTTSIRYIGYLSRLSLAKGECMTNNVKWLAIVSGPEPQRTLLEKSISNFFKQKDGRRVIIQGLANKHESNTIDGIEYISHCSPTELKSLIKNADNIICRSGYSTLMDLLTLNKKALLIPTPGQAEQEYLAIRAKELDFEIEAQKGFINRNKTKVTS